jgi:hypothetical protein
MAAIFLLTFGFTRNRSKPFGAFPGAPRWLQGTLIQFGKELKQRRSRGLEKSKFEFEGCAHSAFLDKLRAFGIRLERLQCDYTQSPELVKRVQPQYPKFYRSNWRTRECRFLRRD